MKTTLSKSLFPRQLLNKSRKNVLIFIAIEEFDVCRTPVARQSGATLPADSVHLPRRCGRLSQIFEFSGACLFPKCRTT